jgi:hypothetical protein
MRPLKAIVTAVGKEEAFYLAEYWITLGLCGSCIAMPTQATSNQMHGRFRDFSDECYAQPIDGPEPAGKTKSRAEPASDSTLCPYGINALLTAEVRLGT